MLALSDATVNGIFAVAIALITGGMGIAGILLSRSTKRANEGIDELARDHVDCLETLDWLLGQMKLEGSSLPPSALRVRAQAARAAAQATREKAERQRARSGG